MQAPANPRSVQLSFRQKEQLFHDLAQLSASGVALVRALDVLAGGRASGISAAARRIRSHLQSTGSAEEAFRAAGFSFSDAAVISAGENSGRLEQIFPELERYYHELANARAAVIARSIYPVVVLHLGTVFLAVPPAIIAGSVTAFWSGVLPILFGFYLAAAAAILAWRAIRTAFARNVSAARILGAFPGAGGFLKDWTAWNFSAVLALYVRSGGGLLKAFEIAGSASGNAVLRESSAAVVARVQSGSGLAEAMREGRDFPEELERAIAVGEHAGRLDQETQRAANFYQGRTLRKLNALAEWLPRILYFLIVVLMGIRAIQMALEVSGAVDSAINGES